MITMTERLGDDAEHGGSGDPASDPAVGRRDRRRTIYRGRQQPDGVLAGHYRQGRVYRPPLAAMEQFALKDWVQDELPDLLWPLALVAMHGDRAGGLLGRAMTAAHAIGGGDHKVVLDGRLTSAEQIPEPHRGKIVELFASSPEHHLLVPPELIGVVRTYNDVPGTWLFDHPWEPSAAADEDSALSFLAWALARVVGDGHMEALVKFAPLAWAVIAKRVTLDQQVIALLNDYPSVPAKFPAADSIIRATFGAQRAAAEARDGRDEVVTRWARAFWQQNWTMTSCTPEEGSVGRDDESFSPPDPDASVPADGQGVPADDDIEQRSLKVAEGITAQFNKFLDTLLDPYLPLDLREPTRHEVVAGLASRAARAALALARTPDLWSGEHGMATIRVLSETEIVLRWMETQDESVFEDYKSYGLGKRKLLRLHMEQLADLTPSLRPILADALEQLEHQTGGRHQEAFQEVSVEATFAGRSLRQMAAEAGADDEYRFEYQTASGVTHGEWWAIEDYAMQRCLNPLHRFHRIPSFNGATPITPDFGDFIASRLFSLLAVASRMLVSRAPGQRPIEPDRSPGR